MARKPLATWNVSAVPFEGGSDSTYRGLCAPHWKVREGDEWLLVAKPDSAFQRVLHNRSWKEIELNIGIVLSPLTAGLAFSFAFAWGLKVVIAVICAGLVIYCYIQLGREMESRKVIELELKNCRQGREELTAVVSQQLSVILEVLLPSPSELNFRPTDRVTVYSHTGSEFVMAGRYSKFTQWSKQSSRASYPDDSGVLGHIWKHEMYYHDHFPDPADYNAYLMALDSESVMLARAEQEKLRMKPRAYFGIKLYNGARAIGVILFETEQDAFCKSKQQLMDWKESSMVMLLERALLLHSTYGQTSEPGTEE